MAAVAQLSVNIAANTSGITAASQALAGLGTSAAAAANTTTQSFNRVNQAAANTGRVVTANSNRAGEAITNLGRVAQDAPFGFVGIQNNLNPLFETFTRLRAEAAATGTTVSRLLISSLSGPAGIGLALSVVSSALTIATMGLGAWTRGFGSAKEAIDEAKEASKALAEATQNAYKSAAEETVKITSLIAVIQNETATRERKKQALLDIQKLEPEIFKGLKLEGDTVVGLDAAYQNYIKNLQTVIAVKIKQAQLEQVTEKILKAQGVTLTGLDKQYFEGTKNLKAYLEAQEGPGGDAARAKAKKEQKEINGLLAQQQTLFGDIKNLQTGVKVTPVKPDKEAEKTAERISDILDKLKADREFLSRNPLVPELDKPLDDIKLIEDAIKRLLELKVPVNGNIIQKLVGMEDYEKLVQANLKKNISKFGTDEPITFPVSIYPEFKVISDGHASLNNTGTDAYRKVLFDKLKKSGVNSVTVKDGVKIPITPFISTQLLEKGNADLEGKLTELSDLVKQATKDMEMTIAVGIGSALGEALTGGDITGAIQGIFSGIGDAVSQLGEQLIIMSGLIQGIQAAFAALSPGGLLLGGIALVALGGTLKNIVGKSTPFAAGGIVSGPTNALVGEYPGARNNPEVIAPLNKLQSMLDMNGGGGKQIVEVFGKLSGTDILLSSKRAQKYVNR